MARSRAVGRRAPRAAFTLIELLVVLAIVGVLTGLLLPALSAARGSARTAVCLARLRTLGQAVWMHAEHNAGEIPRSAHSAGFHRRPWTATLFEPLTGTPFLGDSLIWDSPPWWSATNTHYRCPHDWRESPVRQPGLPFGQPVFSYGINVYFELRVEEIHPDRSGQRHEPWRRLDRLPSPSGTVLFGELPEGSMTDHVMAHFWRTLGVQPGEGVAIDRHAPNAGYLYADAHASAGAFETTFNQPRGVDQWNPDPAKR